MVRLVRDLMADALGPIIAKAIPLTYENTAGIRAEAAKAMREVDDDLDPMVKAIRAFRPRGGWDGLVMKAQQDKALAAENRALQLASRRMPA